MSTSKSGLQARPTSWFPCCAGDGTPGSAGPAILLAFLRLTLCGAFPRPGRFDYAAPPRLHAKQLPRLFAHTARKLSVLSSRRSRMLLPLQLLLETLRTLCSPGWVFVHRSYYLTLAALELAVIPLPPQSWGHRSARPHLATDHFGEN